VALLTCCRCDQGRESIKGHGRTNEPASPSGLEAGLGRIPTYVGEGPDVVFSLVLSHAYFEIGFAHGALRLPIFVQRFC
jgi:hypothetical protein